MRWPHALRSLAHRNLRLFFGGQAVSLVGTWMQSVAQGWLVYRLTSSSELLGLVGFVSQLPVSLFGVWAGSLADRLPRRKVVLATQLNALTQATILAALTFSGAVRPWHVVALAFMLGLSHAFEIPARQALLGDISGADVPNAVALNSTIVNLARVLGPALAGLLVAAVGEAWCFALNALSFVGTIAALLAMRLEERPIAAPPSRRAHLAEGLGYAARTAHIRALFLLLAASSLLALPYTTLLPALVRDVLGGDARTLGVLQGSAGAGALAGAILLLLRRGLGGLGRQVAIGATLLGAGVAAASLTRSTAGCAIALAVAGFGQITQVAGSMTLVQSLAPPELRGRLIGVFSTLFVGVTPFGALAGGVVAGQVGVRPVLLAGPLALIAASVAFHLALPRLREAARAAYRELATPLPPEPTA
jgi:MFS family permease